MSGGTRGAAVGDLLALRLPRAGAPGVVVRITKDRGDVWEVEGVSDLALLGLKYRPEGTDPCVAKDDGMWEALR